MVTEQKKEEKKILTGNFSNWAMFIGFFLPNKKDCKNPNNFLDCSFNGFKGLVSFLLMLLLHAQMPISGIGVLIVDLAMADDLRTGCSLHKQKALSRPTWAKLF